MHLLCQRLGPSRTVGPVLVTNGLISGNPYESIRGVKRIYKYVTRIFQKRERDLRSADGFSELNVPVREIKEVFPAVVVRHSKINLDERTPLGTFGLSNQMHAGFARGAVRFFGVTRDAGANDILPGSRASAIAGNDMVQVQILALEDLSAILAGIMIALEDVVARKLHFLFRHAVKQHQNDDAWDPDAERDSMDTFRVRLFIGEIVPFFEVIGLKRTIRSVQNDLSVAFKEQSESAPGGADINRLPEPVQDQNLLVEERAHTLGRN